MTLTFASIIASADIDPAAALVIRELPHHLANQSRLGFGKIKIRHRRPRRDYGIIQHRLKEKWDVLRLAFITDALDEGFFLFVGRPIIQRGIMQQNLYAARAGFL